MEGIRPDFGKNVRDTFTKNNEVIQKNLDLSKEIPPIYEGIINQFSANEQKITELNEKYLLLVQTQDALKESSKETFEAFGQAPHAMGGKIVEASKNRVKAIKEEKKSRDGFSGCDGWCKTSGF